MVVVSVYFKNQNLGKKLMLNIMPNLGFTKKLQNGDFINTKCKIGAYL